MAMTDPARRDAALAAKRAKAARLRIVVAGAGMDPLELVELLDYASRTSIYRLLEGDQYLKSEQSLVVARHAAGRDAWSDSRPDDIFGFLEGGRVLKFDASPHLSLVAAGSAVTNEGGATNSSEEKEHSPPNLQIVASSSFSRPQLRVIEGLDEFANSSVSG